MRLLGYLAASGLLVWLAWQLIMSMSPPHVEAGSGTSIAMTAGTSSADLVWQLKAQIAAADGAVDWAAISRTARNILRAHPPESRALFVNGLAAEAEGREAEAVALVDLAATRTLRDREAHFWMFSHWLGKRGFGPALDLIEVILLTRPQLGATLLPVLMAVASVPEGRTHLAGLFKTDHPWRGWFLREFSKAADDPSDPSPLHAALQAGSNPPGSAELRPHLDRLIESGRFEQALAIWKASMAPNELQDIDGLYIGDFERPISDLPFDWLVSQPRGAEFNVSDFPVDTGKALRIQIARARVPWARNRSHSGSRSVRRSATRTKRHGRNIRARDAELNDAGQQGGEPQSGSSAGLRHAEAEQQNRTGETSRPRLARRRGFRSGGHYDFYYNKHFSPWIELLIAARTVRIVLAGFGSR